MIKAEGRAGALEIVQKEAGDDGMSKYFGNVRGLTAALGLSGSGMEKYKKHLKEMKNASGATGDALAKMGEADLGKWNKALVRAQNAGIKFGKAVLPAVTPLVEKFGNAISKAADWFSNLTDGQQQMIVKAAAIAAATGPVIKLLGVGASGVGRLLGTVSKFGKALDTVGSVGKAMVRVFPVAGRLITGFGKVFLGVGKIFLSNPILAVIAGIAAGAVLIWKNWDKIKPHLKPIINMFEKLRKLPAKFAKATKTHLNAAKHKFGELKNKAGDLKSGIQSRFDSMKEKVGSFKESVASRMKSAGQKMKTFMKECQTSTTGVKGFLGGLIKYVKGTFTNNWRTAWNGVKQIFSSVWSSIKSTASSALSGISSLVSSIADKISGLLSKIKGAGSAASGISVQSVPGKAVGTNSWRGGPVRVHEKGGEILNLPRGTKIVPHDVSMEMARSAGARSASRSISIAKLADKSVVREEADIDRIATAIVEKLEMLEGDMVYE